MAKYRLGDIAPVCQGMVADSNQCWLLNLDVVESNTGKILEYVYVDHSQIGASTVSFDKMNVLYSKLRPYLNKVVLPDRAGYATSEMLPLRPNGQVITREYLTYFLRSPHFVKYINGKTSGAKMPRANIADLKAVEIECPSINEQNRITTQFDLIARVIEKRQKELSAFDNLIKARFIEFFGDNKVNPYGFEKKRLKDTCTVITGNTPSRSVPEYYGDSIEWIKTDNIVSNQLNPSQAIEYLSDEGMKVGRTVEKGAILMACIAGSVASIGRVCITDRKVAFNQQINAVIPKNYDSLFLYVMLQISKEYLVEEINMALKGILSKSKLECKEFIVPSMEQQKQFATFVSQVDKSKAEVQKSLDEAQILFDSLMQQYFG